MSKLTQSQFKRLSIMQMQLAARKKTGKTPNLPLLKSGLISAKAGFTPTQKPITVITKPPLLTGSPFITGIQIFNPFGGAFWSMLWGTREEKVKAVTGFLPFGYEKINPLTGGSETQTVQQFFTNTIERQKERIEGAKEFYSEKTIAGTEIPAPEFPDVLGFLGNIGKWALLAGALIIGVIIFSRKSNE